LKWHDPVINPLLEVLGVIIDFDFYKFPDHNTPFKTSGGAPCLIHHLKILAGVEDLGAMGQ
jgi:hypothetical protein